ncbi:MAG: YicC family protein [Rubrivivax sp.]|jgi:uncharacterized protein (TIGR00255 family)|nr:YicC family protein [Rubrivivax sp.]
MAVYSMTGYASTLVTAAADGLSRAHLNVELRSVNGRFLDLVFKLPDELRALEPTLREQLGAAFRRGKIEMRLATQREADTAWPRPTPEQLNQLSRLEGTVQSWLPQARGLSVNEVLNWCRGSAATERLDDVALQATAQAIAALREAREREGAKLSAMLRERTQRLRALATQAEPLVPAVVKRQQERFLERWREALDSAGAAGSVPPEALQERALSEAATLAIRIDVAEELSRLRAHLDEIERLLKAGGELGKRLDFLIQELHREANTLGSKSAALELTGIAVEMKVLIEQMREQVQNIE